MSTLRAALGSRRLTGTVVTLPDPVLCELVAGPFDLIWIDLEHGALDVSDVPALAIAARAAGAWSMVRVPAAVPERLSAVLDAGVDGVVFPRIESAAAAAGAVRSLAYPPAGTRGYGPRRAGAFGRAEPAAVACAVQIESAAGVAAALDIAGTAGIDAVIAGPADLTRDPAAGPLPAAVADIVAAARACGTAPGVATVDRALAGLLGAGPGMLVHGVDCRLFAAAADAAAAAARRALA